MTYSSKPVLALDIGGTKLMMACVQGAQVLERRVIKTDPSLGPEGWIAEAAAQTRDWQAECHGVAAAVTGHIEAGHWSAMNTRTLNIPARFPLQARLEEHFKTTALVINDAQAAAWAEYQYGAAAQQDMVFLTVSTGIGGGIVLNGRLVRGHLGLAGHFGQECDLDAPADGVVESQISGRWMASQSSAASDARAVFAASRAGEDWAEAILQTSARRLARLCRNIQLTLDPAILVIGGGIGLAPGYLDRVQQFLEQHDDFLPVLKAAHLGDEAGVIGCADLSQPKQ